MNLKELLKKREELLSTVKTVLGEATAALADGKLDEATELQSKAEGYRKQVDAYTTQIKSLQAADAASSEFEQPVAEPAAETPVAKTAVRPPFETSDEPEEETGVVKSVYVAKFGDVQSAVKGLVKDLYGSENSYMQQRIDQQDAFVKYVRTGRIDAKEEKLLKNVVMLPEQIAQDVKDSVDYKAIKATINESVDSLGGYETKLAINYAYA